MGQTLPQRLRRWMAYLKAAELCFNIDPLLVAAVMDRESNGGDALDPSGPAGTGDGGHGRGLMQIDDRAHPTLAAALAPWGQPLLASPALNILIGAGFLAHLARGFEAMTEDPWLPAIAAYNRGPTRVRQILAEVGSNPTRAELISALDAGSAGNNYVSDVLRRRETFTFPL